MYLNTHSCYSLRYGTIKPKSLLEVGQHYSLTNMALTDINNTSACLDFIRMAPKYGINPVVGIDFRNGADQCFVGLARNNEGFKELNDFLTHHLHNDEPMPDKAPPFQNVFIIYPFSKVPNGRLASYEYIGIRPREVNQVLHSKWKNRSEKWAAMPTATFRHKMDFNAHRLLRSIDNNTLLSKLPKSEEGHPDDRFYSPEALGKVYEQLPEALANTKDLLDNCSIEFEFGTEHPHKNLKYYSGSAERDEQLIRQLCEEGLHYQISQCRP